MHLLNSLKSLLTPAPAIDPATAAARVRAGQALLVDVREPAEWCGGVAKDAALLPLSDLTGARGHWRDFLTRAGGRDVFIYCASGMRSGSAARILANEGIRAFNAGALKHWAAAGWPVITPAR